MKLTLIISLCCLYLLCFFGCSKSQKTSVIDYIKDNNLQGVWAADTNLKTPAFVLTEDAKIHWLSYFEHIDSLQIKEHKDSLFLYSKEGEATIRINKMDSSSLFIDWYFKEQLTRNIRFRKYPLPATISWVFKDMIDSSAVLFLQQLKQNHWCSYDSVQEKGRLMVASSDTLEGLLQKKYKGYFYFYEYQTKEPSFPPVTRTTLSYREKPISYWLYQTGEGFLFFIGNDMDLLQTAPPYTYFFQPINKDTITAFLLDMNGQNKTKFTYCHHPAIQAEIDYYKERMLLVKNRGVDSDVFKQKYHDLHVLFHIPIDAHKKSEYYYEALCPLF